MRAESHWHHQRHLQSAVELLPDGSRVLDGKATGTETAMFAVSSTCPEGGAASKTSVQCAGNLQPSLLLQVFRTLSPSIDSPTRSGPTGRVFPRRLNPPPDSLHAHVSVEWTRPFDARARSREQAWDLPKVQWPAKTTHGRCKSCWSRASQVFQLRRDETRRGAAVVATVSDGAVVCLPAGSSGFNSVQRCFQLMTGG